MTKKNIAKGESFQYAFRRINEAREAGFHLEMIALAESIISDRLHIQPLAVPKVFDVG